MRAAGFFLRFGCTTAAILVGGVGCSSSTPDAAGPSSAHHGSGTRTSPAHATPRGTTPSDPYPALCRRIEIRHAQALFTKPLAPMTMGGSSDCQFFPRGSDGTDVMKVFLRIDDSDKTLFDHVGDISYGRFAPLRGLGYVAKWGSYGAAPSVVDVRNGDFTCTVIPPSPVSNLTLVHTGSALDPTVTRPAAAAYAREIGALCVDVFAA